MFDSKLPNPDPYTPLTTFPSHLDHTLNRSMELCHGAVLEEREWKKSRMEWKKPENYIYAKCRRESWKGNRSEGKLSGWWIGKMRTILIPFLLRSFFFFFFTLSHSLQPCSFLLPFSLGLMYTSLFHPFRFT